MTNLQLLSELDLNEQIRLHPNRPETLRIRTRYSDSTANGLTKAIIRWIILHNGQAERISTMGRYIQGNEIQKGFYGATRTKGKYIPGTGTKGSADISSVVNGKSWKIEVKIGRDKQSEHQRKYQADIERAGGVYTIVPDFDTFVQQWRLL